MATFEIIGPRIDQRTRDIQYRLQTPTHYIDVNFDQRVTPEYLKEHLEREGQRLLTLA